MRKMYQVLAKGMKKNRPENDRQLEQWKIDVDLMTSVFQQSSPTFDREEFLILCGFYGDDKK